MEDEHLRAELDPLDEGAPEIYLLDRTGALLRRMSIEEADALKTDLVVALHRYRKLNPPAIPRDVGGWRSGHPAGKRPMSWPVVNT